MLAESAMKDRKPILAVCRGAQLLSVAAGGTLYQDVGSQYPGAIKHDYFPKAGAHTRQDLVHVESAEDDFVLGVQWHPEDLADSEPKMRRLFDSFIEAAAGWRGGSRRQRAPAAARDS